MAGDPNSLNGTIGYTYDPVGNRTQQTSTLPGITSGGFAFDADDRLASDVYDANGNTVNSGGVGNVGASPERSRGNFENHLIQQGGATMVYDGNGNRVSKTVAGVTTNFLISEINPTGYAQVVSESFSGGTGNREESHSYVYGLDRISQNRLAFINNQNITQVSYYVYDGHGSVRALTDPSGNVTDTYEAACPERSRRNAFGNLIHTTTTQCMNSSTGAISMVALGAACPAGATPSPTANEFLFAGEQFDSDLHLYYNRARYLNVTTGRFWSMDTYEGDAQSPLSLHKYVYADSDPVDGIDPSGNDDLAELTTSFAVNATISSLSTIVLNSSLGTSVASFVASLFIPPDVLQGLNQLTPDAVELGAYGQLNLNTRVPLGLTGYGGFELLDSLKTGRPALYGYVGAGVTIGSTASGGGVGGNVGLVFNCPTSGDYTTNFFDVTIPLGALSSATRTKIETQLLEINVTSLAAGIPASYQSLLIALSNISTTSFSADKVITIFWGPTSPHVFGVSLGVSATISSGASTSNWALSDSYYWQLAPSQSVPFE